MPIRRRMTHYPVIGDGKQGRPTKFRFILRPPLSFSNPRLLALHELRDERLCVALAELAHRFRVEMQLVALVRKSFG